MISTGVRELDFFSRIYDAKNWYQKTYNQLVSNLFKVIIVQGYSDWTTRLNRVLVSLLCAHHHILLPLKVSVRLSLHGGGNHEIYGPVTILLFLGPWSLEVGPVD